MPDSRLLPPLDPSGYGDYLDAQRKQMLAQMLMQNTQRSAQTPPEWDSMKVVPRRSMISTLAPIASSYMAGKALNASQAAQMKYLQGQASSFLGQDNTGAQTQPGVPLQAAPPAADPTAQSVQPAVQRLPGMSLAQTVQASVPQPTQQSGANQPSMIPPGMSPQMAWRLWSTLGPQGYAEKVMLPAQMGTTEWQTLLRATRGNADVAGQLILLKARKAGLTDVRPSGTLVDGAGNPIFTAPGNGVNITWQNGQPFASQVPGSLEAAAAMSGAAKGGEIANTPQTVSNRSGGTTVGYGQDIYGTPPALRSQLGLPGQPVQTSQPAANSTQALAGSGAPSAPTPLGPAQAPAQPPAAPKSYFPGVGSNARNDPFPTAPRIPSYTGLGAPSTTDAMLQKARGEEQAALYKKYGAEADLADQQLVRISEGQRALAGANTGPLSQQITHVQGILHEIAPSLFSGEAATNTQVFNKQAVNNALIGAKQIYGPRMTSQEVMLQKNEANPSSEMTKEAIKYLLNQATIVGQYNRQRAQDFQTYVDAGHDPLRFDGWYSATHSLQQYALQHDAERQSQLARDRGLNIAPGAFEKLTAHPELKDAFRQRFGYIPDGY